MKNYNIIALALAFFLAIYKNFLKLIPIPFCSGRRAIQVTLISKLQIERNYYRFLEKIKFIFSILYKFFSFIFYSLYDLLIINTLLNTIGMICIVNSYLYEKTNIIIFKNTHRFLFKIWDNLMFKTSRKREIRSSLNEEYLTRYYLLFKERYDWMPFNIFIHNFKKSDPDDLHDHPWGFFTYILKGGYFEHIEENNNNNITIKKYWRNPGFYQKVNSSHKHRVELKEDTSCWTLFIPFKREKEWGFFVNNKWIKNDEYDTFLKNKSS